jgi:flagellar biosynthetic protein FliP
MRAAFLPATAALAVMLLEAAPAAAQTPAASDLLAPIEGMASGRMIQLVLAVTVLSLAPGILVMATCFTRFIIALSFLRAGLGLPSTPANLILISLALFMTLTVMAPVFDAAWRDGVTPLIEEKITEAEAYERITKPFRAFMSAHVRPQDVALFENLAAQTDGGAQTPFPAPAPLSPQPPPQAQAAEPELRVLIPAFMLSELKRGFEIGFLIMLPFLVIDLIVATLTMSMGMMMLSPSVISLPFKVMFFVLIDGWNMLIGGLLRSFF